MQYTQNKQRGFDKWQSVVLDFLGCWKALIFGRMGIFTFCWFDSVMNIFGSAWDRL